MRELSMRYPIGRMFWVMFAAYAFSYFHRLYAAAASPDIISTLRIDTMQFGIIGSMTFYGYALVQPVAGFLSDTLGVRKTCAFGLGLAGAGAIAFGGITYLPALAVARFLVGMGIGTIPVCAWKLFAEWFSPEKYTRVVCYFLTAAGVGGLMASSPLVWMNNNLGWQYASMIMGLITCMAAGLIWMVIMDASPEYALDEDKNGTLSAPASKPFTWAGLLASTGTIIRLRRFWFLASWYASVPTALFVFNGLWAGPMLSDVYQLSSMQIGSILAMTAISITLTVPLFAHLMDTVFKSRRWVMFGGSVCTVVGILILICFTDKLGILALYVLCFIIPFADSTGGGVVSLIREAVPKDSYGMAFGILNAMLFGAAAIMQSVFGLIVNFAIGAGNSAAQAYSLAFVPTAIIGIIGVFICFRFPD